MMKKLITTMVALGAITGSTAKADRLFDSLNEKGYGKFSGKLQTLTMQKDFSNKGNSNSTVGSLKLCWKSPEFGNFTIGLEGYQTDVLTSGGGAKDKGKDAGVFLKNGGFHVLNQAYINYNFATFGLEKTNLRVGRQMINTEWFTDKCNRIKNQAIEGITLQYNDLESFNLQLGHIERVSLNHIPGATSNSGKWGILGENSWQDVEDVISGDMKKASGHTKGMQYIQGTYSGINKLQITLYDFYADKLLNTAGTLLRYKLFSNESFSTSIRFHYIHQNSLGDGDDTEHNSNVYDLSFPTQFNGGKSTIEPGFMSVAGGNKNSNRFIVPFYAHNRPCSEMLAITKPNSAGADTWYLRGTTKFGKRTKIIATFYYTNHDSAVQNWDGYEANLVVKHKFTDDNQFGMVLKAGYGATDGIRGAKHVHATDLRANFYFNF